MVTVEDSHLLELKLWRLKRPLDGFQSEVETAVWWSLKYGTILLYSLKHDFVWKQPFAKVESMIGNSNLQKTKMKLKTIIHEV